MTSEQLDASPVVGDFGYAIKLDDLHNSKKRVGSVGYTAPEVLLGDAYDAKCDVYSLGCLLYALVAAELPLYSKSLKEYFYKT